VVVLEERGNYNPYEDIDKFKEMNLRDDLFIFQTLEILDIFDWEKSVYDQEDYDIEINAPTYVSQFSLKEPEGGFPPLFRLPPIYSVDLFISREAREALKEAGITGNSFASLLNPMGDSVIDVPL
ncbi:MAG: hypothetical protein WA902_17730, partial [Thermosynechococcaceae cyanobacterium]